MNVIVNQCLWTRNTDGHHPTGWWLFSCPDTPGGRMSESRPNPITNAESLRVLAGRWKQIEDMVPDGNPKGGASFGRPDSAVPSASLIAITQDIDRFARFHAQVLLDETTWKPTGRGTWSLLHDLAARIGHFTNGDDAQLAWAFADELDELNARALNAIRPDGTAWVDVGHHCNVPGCGGRYKVRINRDRGHVPGWRPRAMCFSVDANGGEHMNMSHALDGMILAAFPDTALPDEVAA